MCDVTRRRNDDDDGGGGVHRVHTEENGEGEAGKETRTGGRKVNTDAIRERVAKKRARLSRARGGGVAFKLRLAEIARAINP